MITIKVDKNTLDKIEQDFKGNITERNIGYILFVAKTDEHIITAYENKKGVTFKVTFQGGDYLSLAKKYCPNTQIIPKKAKLQKESVVFIDVESQIGSDEVGTGDFLGPIVVCAAYADHETMKLISEYGIQDSKKLTDSRILEVVPLLLKKVFYEVKVLTNEKYNNAINKGFNINKIKAILHNFVLTRLYKKCPYVKNIYMDQFCTEKQYYEYLEGSKSILKNIIFKEKGETYFPSVALGSCIARYYFLKEIESLNEHYNLNFPLGAGKNVDEFTQKFISKYGFDELKKVSKNNFRNFQDLNKINLF